VTIKFDPVNEAYNVARVFFKPNWRDIIIKHNTEKLHINIEDTIKWLQEHPLPKSKERELVNFLRHN